MTRVACLALVLLAAACAPIEVRTPAPVIVGCALFPPYPLQPAVEAALRVGLNAGRAIGDTVAVEQIRAHVKAVGDHVDIHDRVCGRPGAGP